MNIYEKIFKARKAFIGYLTAGHGGIYYTVNAAKSLVEAGVDILEIGVPFSDPIADGPAIQNAMNSALKRGINIQDVFQIISRIKKFSDLPIVLFSYLNPLMAFGLEKSCNYAKKSGVDGILIVDMPIEESTDFFKYCHNYSLQPIGLISPSTEGDRLLQISSFCNSFLYYVCRNGTTGMQNSVPDDYAENMVKIKLVTNKPVVSGFGIGNKNIAQEILQYADGFVVGSAFVDAISAGASPNDLYKLALEIDPRTLI